jgi:general secretion pathway protein H
MPQTNRDAGFTLMELLAVMLIIALVSSLAVSMVPGTGRAGLKAVTLNAAALLRRERLRAMISGHAQRVFLDDDHRALTGEKNDRVIIPRDVKLDALGTNELWSRHAVVQFDPEGGSSGAVLRFLRQKAQYDVRVNWYTGSVTIEASESE